jgi:hypothetical protein
MDEIIGVPPGFAISYQACRARAAPPSLSKAG